MKKVEIYSGLLYLQRHNGRKVKSTSSLSRLLIFSSLKRKKHGTIRPSPMIRKHFVEDKKISVEKFMINHEDYSIMKPQMWLLYQMAWKYLKMKKQGYKEGGYNISNKGKFEALEQELLCWNYTRGNILNRENNKLSTNYAFDILFATPFSIWGLLRITHAFEKYLSEYFSKPL